MELQQDIFGNLTEPTQDMPGLIEFKPDFFDPVESAAMLTDLKDTIAWRQETLFIYGKKILTPRLSAWYGDPGISYRYSGVTFITSQWTSTLLDIKEKAEDFAQTPFNSVLLNMYRDGNDSMSWHSDDEKELGSNPIIASVNFGEARRFDFRKKSDHKEKREFFLSNGSILVMRGNIQHEWQHQIAKSKKVKDVRINLTFRFVKN